MLYILIFFPLCVAVTLFANYSLKKKILPKELARKIPHIVISSISAFAPFIVSYEFIVWFAIALLILAWVMKKFGLFNHLREIGRLSWGEFFIPLGIITVAFMEPNEWVFCAAVLIMGLADAAAAIVGSQWGRHSFVYLGHKKSIEGSTAFLLVAMVITYLLVFVVPSGLETAPVALILVFPFVITAVEAFAPFGTDNFFIPVVTTAAFTYLA